MDHFNTTFFCEKGKYPHIEINKGSAWKYVVHFCDNSKSNMSYQLSFHIKDKDDMESFIKELQTAFKKTMATKKPRAKKKFVGETLSGCIRQYKGDEDEL